MKSICIAAVKPPPSVTTLWIRVAKVVLESAPKKLISIAIALLGVWSVAFAQDYPKSQIKYIYPFAAGSTADAAWRIINEEAAKQLGQPIVQLNRVGAGGRIGFAELMRTNPDGYTIGLVSNVTAVVQPLIDPVDWKATPGTDYTPIILGFEYPLILVARKSAPFRDLKSFLAYAKQNPGKINGGSSGIGGGPHLGLAALNMLGGIDITHVPYGGNALAVSALLAGDVDVMWTDIAAKQHLDAGTMIALGVASTKRWNLFPNVPTIEEAGLPGIVLQSWSGLAGPPGLPQKIVESLNAAYGRALSDPDLRARMTKDGWTLLGGTPSDLTARVKEGQEFFGPLIRRANLTRQK